MRDLLIDELRPDEILHFKKGRLAHAKPQKREGRRVRGNCCAIRKTVTVTIYRAARATAQRRRLRERGGRDEQNRKRGETAIMAKNP